MALLALENDIHAGRLFEPSRTVRPQTRRLSRGDRQAIEAFFLGLDRDTRCWRFGHAASDDNLRTHTLNAINNATSVIGIFADAKLRGVLELYSCAPAPIIEAALVVDESWRRRGLGHALLSMARASEPRNLRLIFTRDNWPMRHLAMKMRAHFDLVLDEICADIATNCQTTAIRTLRRCYE
jgi:GNAT superfamily N-acetyltransferase